MGRISPISSLEFPFLILQTISLHHHQKLYSSFSYLWHDFTQTTKDQYFILKIFLRRRMLNPLRIKNSSSLWLYVICFWDYFSFSFPYLCHFLTHVPLELFCICCFFLYNTSNSFWKAVPVICSHKTSVDFWMQ